MDIATQNKARECLAIVTAKGKGEIHELQVLFDIYNEHKAEITGDLGASREIAPHCSGCVERVVTRLRKYLDGQK